MPITNPFQFFKSADGPEVDRRIHGKIINIDKRLQGGGYGFISSEAIPYKRIFFYWTELISYDFLSLEVGMNVSFIPIEIKEKTDKDGKLIPAKGWRALKVKVESE